MGTLPEDVRVAIIRSRARLEGAIPEDWLARWCALGGGPSAAVGGGGQAHANQPVPQRAASQECGAEDGLDAAVPVVPAAGGGRKPRRKRPGVVPLPEVASGGHDVLFVGRSLRCLRCFLRPEGNRRVWRRASCVGELPPLAMPGGLGADILRHGALAPGVPAATLRRWSELRLHAASVGVAGLAASAGRER